MEKLENIGFIIKAILTIVDLALPTHRLNIYASDEKRALIVAIMDSCHKIYRLNISNVSSVSSISNTSDTNSNINTKEGN
jgi:hypothetical protein